MFDVEIAKPVRATSRWMGSLHSAMFVLMFLSSFAAILAQEKLNIVPAAENPSGPVKPGIVIEKFNDEFSGAKHAGMQPGDILLRWSQGSVAGNLDSPFALSLVANDRFPRGPVKFEGLRGNEERVWTVSKQYWGTQVRPNFSDAVLHGYHEAMQKVEAGQVAAAVERWHAVIGESEKARYPWIEPWFLGQTAASLANGQHWKESDDAYQQAIQEAASNTVRARLMADWGYQLYRRSDWDRAEVCFRQAITDGEQLDAGEFVADNYATLGMVIRGRGDLSRSQEYFAKALEIRQKIEPGMPVVAISLLNLGLAFVDRGELGEAERHYVQALSIFEKKTPATVGVAYLLNNLGDLAQKRGDLAGAERYLRRSLAMIEKIDPGTVGHAIILKTLADILEEKGDTQQAERILERSLATIEKVASESPEDADVLEGLGDFAQHRGDFNGAAQAYQHALAIREKLAPEGLSMAQTIQALGDIAFAQEDLTKAESYYQHAMTIRDRLAPQSAEYANTLAALAGVARRQGRLDAAISSYKKALDALEKQNALLGGSVDIRAGYRAKHDHYYREYLDLLLAQNNPEFAFEVLERSRARTLLETLATAHIDIRRGVDPELIKKERSLQADIKAKSERRVHLLSEKQSEDQLRAVEKEISALTSDYQDVEAHIRSSSPEYAALTQPRPLSAQEIQRQLLDSDTLLLEYSLGEERSHVFVVASDSLAAYALPKRAAIEAAARGVYELLTMRNRRIHGENSLERAARIARAEAEYAPAAERLSRMILGPIAGKLARKRVLIVSDGVLHYVPFGALPVSGAGRMTLPLVAEHEIVNLPSATVLAVLRRERMGRLPPAKTVAVLADPVFDSGDIRVKQPGLSRPGYGNEARSGDGETQTASVLPEKAPAQAELEYAGSAQPLELAQLTRSAGDVGWGTRRGEVYLPRLQSTRREAEAIVAVTPAGQSFEALDFKANRATATSAELANYRIVHFATHALLNSKHPELSGLVLSLVDERGRPQNGFLGLEDIYNLNLPTELVVLSACETALGKGVEGEGMVGLTRGFMYAGAGRVMASLWKIDDRATADQMRYFYRAMVGQGMPPAAALRMAQLKMRQDPRWSPPYFWAAFQIQGEWK